MNRNEFLKSMGALSAGLLLSQQTKSNPVENFPVVRTPLNVRKFSSSSVEQAIATFKAGVANKELGWLFENCFPNTLDTTVFYTTEDGLPSTYVITGDIDAMWLRDSTAQVWPYLSFIRTETALQQLIAGVIHKQTKCILKDPYANAFYNDEKQESEWKSDLTQMLPGIHERKWEIDSLCYPIRLAHGYWTTTHDSTPFTSSWLSSIRTILRVFKEQQRKENQGPYTFQRTTSWATDGVPLGGYGYPVKPVGLICSMFRPSDDATIFPFLIPSNLFAIVSLRQAASMVKALYHDSSLENELLSLALEVENAVKEHGIIQHPRYGKMYAYEVNGSGSYNLMDDANVPSLLSLPYLNAVSADDAIYKNTRRFLLSTDNPFFFKGKSAEGIGGPHVGIDMIWPLSIIMRGLTSIQAEEIRLCIDMLRRTHGGTGFMHEAFYKDDATRFTRKWFAWANTLFGEFLWKVYVEQPDLLR